MTLINAPINIDITYLDDKRFVRHGVVYSLDSVSTLKLSYNTFFLFSISLNLSDKPTVRLLLLSNC